MKIDQKVIDLCAGFGGGSEAFLQAGYDVMRVENNPLLCHGDSEHYVPNTWKFDLSCDLEVASLIHMHYWDEADLIWASPPCLEFSFGFNAPGPTAKREGRDFEPDMTILRNVIKIIKAKKPKYWVIENVKGAAKIFSKELGVNAPRQIIGPYYLWGNFPYISMPRTWEHGQEKTKVWNIGDPLRANKRAIIPFELSQALLNSMQEQKQITEWIQ